jgi:hypothetical protein
VVIKQELKNYDEFDDDNYDEGGYDEEPNWVDDDEMINDVSSNEVLTKVAPKKRKVARVKLEKFPDQTEVKPEAIIKAILNTNLFKSMLESIPSNIFWQYKLTFQKFVRPCIVCKGILCKRQCT